MNPRVTAFAAALALMAGALAGCATTSDDLSSSTAVQMQSTVVAVAESAAAGDAAGALTELDELQRQLEAALADGSVSAERAAAIQSRIDLVRADLQPEPAPVVEPTTDPAPAPAPAPGDDAGGGNENSGPGNNEGNNGGDDKGKGKGKDD